VMENHNWSSIQGSSQAPYLNHTLLPESSYGTQYYNPPSNHPSLPNYLWLEAGTNCFPGPGCIHSDLSPTSYRIHSRAHLTALLNRAGISWRNYSENINGKSCPLSQNSVANVASENGLGGNLYAPRHDPFIYFADNTNNFSSSSPTCIQHVRPFTEFARDLAENRVARYNFITPNLCDDMHSACPIFSSSVRQGDKWLSRVIPRIQSSAAYRNGGVIFIAWDEGVLGDGPIGIIVLSPDARGHGFHNAIHYTHSSTLRTVEEIFGLHPLLGGAAHATDLRGLFKRFP
jgi:phosphatidylinositol-3-phosphatase